MATQANRFCQKCKECQIYIPCKRKYGQLPPKNVGKLTPLSTVHIDLIRPYTIITRQNQLKCETKEVELHLACITMLDPATGWFENVEVHNFIIEDMKTKSI